MVAAGRRGGVLVNGGREAQEQQRGKRREPQHVEHDE